MSVILVRDVVEHSRFAAQPLVDAGGAVAVAAGSSLVAGAAFVSPREQRVTGEGSQPLGGRMASRLRSVGSATPAMLDSLPAHGSATAAGGGGDFRGGAVRPPRGS
eukprot:318365-Chlamydomonas_euryale.AAC.1